MMKYKIEIRKVLPGNRFNSGANYTVIGEIKRKLRGEQIGNFNPIFCTYKGERELVHSAEGDLSDPFRREENYFKKLFIRVE